MSRAAKTTFALSAALSAFIVVGVHWQQSAERENMYKGVLRDQARLEAKRAAAAAGEEGEANPSNSNSSSTGIVAPPLPPSQATPEARYQDWLRNREREQEFQRLQPTKAFLDRQRQEGNGDGPPGGWRDAPANERRI
ncbi:hypothetical protein OC834_004458 [Tilletia horrida]|nr:hypothetical protein OC834_004458 [Tilletia horrida]